MIFCKELNKEFATKQEMFESLQKNKDEIIGLKKAQIQKSIDKGVSVTAKPLDFTKVNEQNKSLSLDDNHYYIAVNSTRVLDSHQDLHLDGIWNKTTKEQQGKNYLVDTHVMSLNTTIARKEHIQIFTATISFSMIGKSYEGDTQVLVYKIPKDKIINQIAKDWLESGDSIEASVRMRYTDLVLAMNSDRKDDKEEKKNYDKYISVIANKEDFEEEIYYFWAIKQAQNINESSLVLFGSNSTTGQIENNNQADNKSLDSTEPSQDTPSEHLKFYQHLN